MTIHISINKEEKAKYCVKLAWSGTGNKNPVLKSNQISSQSQCVEGPGLDSFETRTRVSWMEF